jgi:hypothetical protein
MMSIEVKNGKLNIELSGSGTDAQYMAAVLVEPGGTNRAISKIISQQKERFSETWRVAKKIDRHSFNKLRLEISSSSAIKNVAPDSSVVMDFMLFAAQDDADPLIIFSPPGFAGNYLAGELRYGHWRFERPNASATLLRPTQNHLRGDLDNIKLIKAVPRRLNIHIRIPKSTPQGSYSGNIQVMSHGEFVTRNFTINVLPVVLPPVEKPIGIYMEQAPHLTWFRGQGKQRKTAKLCDLNYLRKVGLTGIAPPLATPTKGKNREFLAQMRQLKAVGFKNPILAYTPVKRLLRRMSAQKNAEQIHETERQLKAQGLPKPLWAIADEAHKNQLQQIKSIAQAMHHHNPNIKVAGQLNNPRQSVLLPDLDVALVNPSFGVDTSDLDRLRAADVSPWFYNMPQPRLAAGFYLWRTGAEGYLQWHGRMPTADPFDPTDGREADIQFLFPTINPCPKTPDIHASLFQIIQGITDLRWLLWLESQVDENDKAKILRDKIYNEIPQTWSGVLNLQDNQVDQWRDQIMTLVQRRK